MINLLINKNVKSLQCNLNSQIYKKQTTSIFIIYILFSSFHYCSLRFYYFLHETENKKAPVHTLQIFRIFNKYLDPCMVQYQVKFNISTFPALRNKGRM